jgi:hypothetical protein
MEKLFRMKRYDIINKIIVSKGYKNYLEIGVRGGECFQKIACENKLGVDPVKISESKTHEMSSDDFFASLNEDTKFDCVFIDGLHLDEQVYRDIENSLKFLSEDGVILLHDCNPPTKFHAGETPVYGPPANGDWNGTVYLALIKLRLYKADLCLTTIDTDWGVGIIRKSPSETLDVFPNDALNWDFFKENKKQILNLIAVEEFDRDFNFILGLK